MRMIQGIALALVLIGAINWGLMGLFQIDLVAGIFGDQANLFSRIIYTLIGVSGLVSIPLFFYLAGIENRFTKREQPYSRNFAYESEFAEEEDLKK